VKFKQNNHIEGSENWKGEKYRAFSNYNAQWHDQGWWHQHYNRVILISGGYYFWNSGFWYPAWGMILRILIIPMMARFTPTMICRPIR